MVSQYAQHTPTEDNVQDDGKGSPSEPGESSRWPSIVSSVGWWLYKLSLPVRLQTAGPLLVVCRMAQCAAHLSRSHKTSSVKYNS